MAEYLIQGETLTEIADAIRAKNGTTESLSPEQMATAVESIQVGVDTSDATASAAEILSGETAYVNGEKVTGSMTNNGAVSPAALAAGSSYTIPQGYHDGSGVVSAKDLASQTDGTATAAQILSGQTAYVDGSKVTGSMTNNGAVAPSALNAGGSYTIPAGYHNGSGKVTTNSLASQTSANATAAQILASQTAYVNGSKITGTMTNQGAKTATLNAGQSYTIPAGYHNGSGKVTANSLASQGAAIVNTTSQTLANTTSTSVSVTLPFMIGKSFLFANVDKGASFNSKKAVTCILLINGTLYLVRRNDRMFYNHGTFNSSTGTFTVDSSADLYSFQDWGSSSYSNFILTCTYW